MNLYHKTRMSKKLVFILVIVKHLQYKIIVIFLRIVECAKAYLSGVPDQSRFQVGFENPAVLTLTVIDQLGLPQWPSMIPRSRPSKILSPLQSGIPGFSTPHFTSIKPISVPSTNPERSKSPKAYWHASSRAS